ncbi:MAG: 4Fe-4S dicluster domain-containing protein [Proteobacteria bacterium]|nr:4Fe-4S dicluster domain-containing protein [Pseudomonadota bacterium]
MKVIGVHTDRCTGCKTCELYCGAERGSEGKTLLKAVQETPAPQPRIRVEGSRDRAFPLQCRHCLQAPCLDACLTGALVRDAASGMVLIREDRCIGCWTCTAFCPYGVIVPSPERKIAIKCDRCLYMEKPSCVEVCPTKALELVDIEAIDGMLREKRRNAAEGISTADGEGVTVLDLGR